MVQTITEKLRIFVARNTVQFLTLNLSTILTFKKLPSLPPCYFEQNHLHLQHGHHWGPKIVLLVKIDTISVKILSSGGKRNKTLQNICCE